MDKIICDVCGTEYPETEAQCPICGCARADSVQSEAQDIQADVPADEEYKGARFSKSNVNRRTRRPAANTNSTIEHNYVPEEDDDDEEDEPRSNVALIAIVVVLLLAIIAVSTYIAVSFFGKNDKNPTITTKPSTGVQMPVNVPCTDLQVSTEEVTLNAIGQVYNITVLPFPANTTDVPSYTSKDPLIAAVTGNGQVTALAEGSTVITITCGDIVRQVNVSCAFGTTEPSAPPTTQPTTQPSTAPTTQPTTKPVAPAGSYTIMIDNYRSMYTSDDGTFVEATIKIGEKHWLTVVDSNKVRQDVTWELSKDGVCSLSGNDFKGIAKGTVTISATFNGVKYACKVTVK